MIRLLSSKPLPFDVPMRDGFPTFSETEIAHRHARVRSALESAGLDCLLLYGAGRFHADVQYLTNWPGGREAYVVLPLEHEPVLLAQLFNHVPMAQRLSLIRDTRWAGPDSIATTAEVLRDRLRGGQRRVGIVGGLPFTQYEKLRALLPDVAFTDFGRQFRDLRQVRSDEEILFFRIAGEVTDRSIDRLAEQLRPGMRESELALLVETAYLEVGGYAGIHFMASAPMRNPERPIFVPHQYQSDRVLQAGDVLITEISGAFWGFSGQIHRTFFLGEPTPEWAKLHQVAVDAYEAIEAVLKDGATLEDVLDAAELIDRAGYTIFDDLLHGANQYPPIMKTRSTNHSNPKEFTFRAGMVETIQPQVTTRDRTMGLQFGETVLIAERGTERLHRYPREMVVVRDS